MKRAFYSDSIDNFLQTPTDTIIGRMAQENPFSLVQEQRNSWVEEISFLKEALSESSQKTGAVYLEFSIPRMGLRVDAVVLLGGYLFVIEFKLGNQQMSAQALDQVYDYALDLKNFHETSHASRIVPLLVISGIKGKSFDLEQSCHQDNLFKPILCRPQSMGNVFKKIVDSDETTPETMDPDRWIS